MSSNRTNAPASKNSSSRNTSTHETGIFPVEFINHVRNLREIRDHFADYGRKFDVGDKFESEMISEIKDHLSGVADCIGDLVSREFKSNVYCRKEDSNE